MSFLSSNLFKRIGTAVVGGPIIIGLALWSNPWGWNILILVATLLALIEYAQMAFDSEQFFEKLSLLFPGVVIAALLIFVTRFWQYYILFYPWASIILLLTVILLPGEIKKSAFTAGKLFIGVFFIAQLLAFSAMIKVFPQGGRWIIFTLTIVWFGDTGAYFTGKSIGKHKFAPRISPNKTWEGSIGGSISSALAGVLATFYISGLPVITAVALAVVVGFFGQMGDLAESMLKRSFDVKDSGNLLPGHGGILDRVDALLFASPIIFAYLWISYTVA